MLFVDNWNILAGLIYFFTPGFGSTFLLVLGIIAFVGPFILITVKTILNKKLGTGSCGIKMIYWLVHVTNTAEF